MTNKQIKTSVEQYIKDNPEPNIPITVDSVTGSADNHTVHLNTTAKTLGSFNYMGYYGKVDAYIAGLTNDTVTINGLQPNNAKSSFNRVSGKP